MWWKRRQVLPKAMEIAEKIAANGPIAVRAIRKSAKACLGLPEQEALKLESQISGPVFQTEDAREGPKASSGEAAQPALRIMNQSEPADRFPGLPAATG
ncbi:MAG: hypothetical protein U5R48_01310 [Gammaproteobacteria bacterium]|nr:hypothetical protein [Gammaproteobacteria bacterium]